MLSNRENWIKLAAIILILISIYALLGFFIAPHLTKRAMIQYFSKNPDAIIQVDDVQINPFTLAIEIEGLALIHGAEKSILSTNYIYADLKLYSLLAGAVILDDVIIENAEINLSLDKDGKTNFSWLLTGSDETTDAMVFEISSLQLRDSKFLLSDKRSESIITQEIHDIDLQMMNFGTRISENAEYLLSMGIGDKGRAELTGQINLVEIENSGSLSLKNIELADFSSWIPASYVLQISARIGLQTDFALIKSVDDWQLELNNGRLQIDAPRLHPHESIMMELESARIDFAAAIGLSEAGTSVRLSGVDSSIVKLRLSDIASERTLFSNDNIIVKGAQLDSVKKLIGVAEINLMGSEIAVIRNKNGELDWLDYISRIRDSEPAAVEMESSKTGGWKVNIEKALIESLDAQFSDRTTKLANTQMINDMSLKFSELTNTAGEQSKFELKANLNNAGTMEANGWFDLAQKIAELEIELDSIALTPFDPYLRERSHLQITNGLVSIQGKITVDKERFNSNVNAVLEQLSISDSQKSIEVISSSRISVKDIALKGQPLAVGIKLVEIEKPYMDIGINAQRRLNMTDWFVLTDLKDKNTTETNTKVQDETTDIIISRVKVIEGSINFSDASLSPTLKTKLHSLNGDVVGLNFSAEETPAELQLDGQVGEFGQVNIKGMLTLFNPARSSQVDMLLQNIDTALLSPYAGRFAGRAITSGKLELDLRYKISGGSIIGDNAIVLKDLVLGERVESPDAQDLPLDMAIALLQDKNGKIDISIPVTGDLNNPEFDISALIGKAVGNLLGNIVKAPFKALASIFGDKEKSLDQIPFTSGRADITPPAAEIIESLAKALTERPVLAIQINAGYDPILDRNSIAETQLQARVRIALGESKDSISGPVPLSFTDSITQQAIETLAIDELTEKEISTHRLANSTLNSSSATKGENGEADNRVFYRSLYRELLRRTHVSDDELLVLAENRGHKIESALQMHDIAKRRIAIVKIGAMKAAMDKKISLELKIIALRE